MSVGLVVVSHSHALATAAVGLAREMVTDSPVRIEIAAGLDETTFGTDATAIMAAVEAADDGRDGVVVLMDLGSAVMSAELAVEMLDPDLAARVVLSPAPLVEGLVVAAVGAAGGQPAHRVAADAAAALQAKQEQLGGDALVPKRRSEAPDQRCGTNPHPTAAFAQAEVEVTNPQGLHARPAARLVATVTTYAAEVTLRNLTTDVGPVPADSLVLVSTLGAAQGHRLLVEATGPEARAAVDGVRALAADGFGDA